MRNISAVFECSSDATRNTITVSRGTNPSHNSASSSTTPRSPPTLLNSSLPLPTTTKGVQGPRPPSASTLALTAELQNNPARERARCPKTPCGESGHKAQTPPFLFNQTQRTLCSIHYVIQSRLALLKSLTVRLKPGQRSFFDTT